jgi:hypothetical protein
VLTPVTTGNKQTTANTRAITNLILMLCLLLTLSMFTANDQQPFVTVTTAVRQQKTKWPSEAKTSLDHLHNESDFSSVYLQ